MTELEFEIEGRKVRGKCLKIKGELWIHSEGKTWVYQPEVKGAKKKKGGVGDKETIAAPMPGKITQILVKPGDEVQAGQTVIAMEAMKMEYALKAHHPAKVLEVTCSVGVQVALGQVLARLQPTE